MTTKEKHPRPLEITREFNAPVERLFKAFTDSKTLMTWWWPKGLYADRVDWDFREGGAYFINMNGGEQGGGGMTGRFEEIVANERIVMTDHFADENGRVLTAREAKMPGDWPAVVRIALAFDSLGEEKSRLRLSQEGIPDELQKDCKQGWNESFDKLDFYLEEPRRSPIIDG